MARNTLDEARAVIERRLKELRAEVHELESALRRLGNGSAGARGPRSTRARARTRTRAASRPRRGRRTEQFKQALSKQPGAAVSEISKKLGISSQHGHGIAKRLRDRGEIKKQGNGYALKS